MYIMDAIFYGHDEVLKDIDVIFSGYGLDWFFQGCTYHLTPLVW